MTVARAQGLTDGNRIPRDMRRAMANSANLEQKISQELISYRWPDQSITKVVDKISKGMTQDSIGIKNILKANKWRAPDWSRWWQAEDEARKLLGIKVDAACPGWPLGDDGAFRYISAVCPTRNAYDIYLKNRDRAIRQGMKVGDLIPRFLLESMVTSAIYYERSGYQLWDLGTPNPRANTLARRLAEREYADAEQVRAVVKSGRWKEPLWVTDFQEIVREIRRELKLPPADPAGCPA